MDHLPPLLPLLASYRVGRARQARRGAPAYLGPALATALLLAGASWSILTGNWSVQRERLTTIATTQVPQQPVASPALDVATEPAQRLQNGQGEKQHPVVEQRTVLSVPPAIQPQLALATPATAGPSRKEPAAQAESTAVPEPVAQRAVAAQDEPASVEFAAAEVRGRRATERDTQWLMQLPGSRYTIQLVTLFSEADLQDYLQRRDEDPNVGHYTVTRNGTDYFAAIYGNYETFADATLAQASLPAGLGATQPMVRSVAQLQKNIANGLKSAR